jgi:hypothetical protein
MAESVTNDRPPGAARPRSRKPATVSASALAVHLDCSRTYIGKLEAKGVIQRQGDDFPLDTLPICDTCGANIGDHREAEPQRYRIARQRHLDRLLCQRRRSGVQRDYSIRRSLRTKKQLSVTGTGTCTQSRLTGPGIRALDFKLLGLKERPPP